VAILGEVVGIKAKKPYLVGFLKIKNQLFLRL